MGESKVSTTSVDAHADTHTNTSTDTNSGTCIDIMSEADLPDVRLLAEQLGYPIHLDDLTRRFKFLTNSAENELFVARKGNRHVVGWIHVGREMASLLADDRADIGALVVDSRSRSQGIGAQLLASAEKWAMKNHLKLVRVRSNVRREDAHRFYERQGYRLLKTGHMFTKELHGASV